MEKPSCVLYMYIPYGRPLKLIFTMHVELEFTTALKAYCQTSSLVLLGSLFSVFLQVEDANLYDSLPKSQIFMDIISSEDKCEERVKILNCN